VTERRVAKIVGKCREFDQIKVECPIRERLIGRVQHLADAFRNLRHFKRVRQPVAKEVRLMPREELGLALESPK
jgi:hypothetical protein